ncbi:MAG: hypothetical protein ACRD8W_14095 [Nitrososphaeraceae archaeon]
MEIAKKLGVDNTTISKDIKIMKLISQQFIYDIPKSDFTYYYKQCLDMVKLVLKRQMEIVDKEQITMQDMNRAKILSDILSTVATINGYYSAAPEMHQTPMQRVLHNSDERFGVRPGTKRKIYKMTPEDEAQMLKEWEEEDEAELKAIESAESAAKMAKAT